MNRPNRGRRKRDEPFNPFAKNAIQERNRRQAERAKEQRLKDNLASQTSKPEIIMPLQKPLTRRNAQSRPAKIVK